MGAFVTGNTVAVLSCFFLTRISLVSKILMFFYELKMWQTNYALDITAFTKFLCDYIQGSILTKNLENNVTA